MAKHHPNKEVSDAIAHALRLGWTMIDGTGHLYVMLRCPQGDRTGCQVPVFCTPKNPGNHARRTIREVNACRCPMTNEGDDA